MITREEGPEWCGVGGVEILLSILPIYAERILQGTKGFEFRRVMPARPVSRVWLYATVPVGRIVGWFDPAAVLSGPPSEMWDRTRETSGIEAGAFRRYFEGAEVAHAFEVARTWALAQPVDPRERWPGFRAPQSFRYMGSLEAASKSIRVGPK